MRLIKSTLIYKISWKTRLLFKLGNETGNSRHIDVQIFQKKRRQKDDCGYAVMSSVRNVRKTNRSLCMWTGGRTPTNPFFYTKNIVFFPDTFRSIL